MSLYDFVATACIAWALGVFIGHAAGYARGRAVGRPRYRRRGNFHVSAPSGAFIDTPSRESADAFATKYGGDVTVGRPE